MFSSDCLEKVIPLLRSGMPVAFPTESVYGVGVPLSSTEGVARIYALKGRGPEKPLTVHVCRLEEMALLGELCPLFYRLAEAFLPGPLTLVVEKRGGGSVGFRFPSHPVALELIERVGEPLLATSVNLTGEPPLVDPKQILELFGRQLGGVIEGGPLPLGIASTVLSLVGSVKILREGAISKEAIEEVIKKV